MSLIQVNYFLNIVANLDNLTNDEYVPMEAFTHLGLIVFIIGLLGILSNKKNLLLSLISIEMMLFGANILLVLLSAYIDDIAGQIGSILILVLAGADSALALSIIVVYFKMFDNIFILVERNEKEGFLKSSRQN